MKKWLLFAILLIMSCISIYNEGTLTQQAKLLSSRERAELAYYLHGFKPNIDYAFYISNTPSINEKSIAACWSLYFFNNPYYVIVYPLFFTFDDYEQDQILIHEIAHCSYNLDHVPFKGEVMSETISYVSPEAWDRFWLSISQTGKE